MCDSFYYKKRCGFDIASLEAIDFIQDAEDMVQNSGSERKVRLILTKQQETERHVNITPLKQFRQIESNDEEDDDDELGLDESLDAYKDWLEDKGPRTDLRDDYRQQTVTTYTEWLREQGHLEEISVSYTRDDPRMTVQDESNDSNASQEVYRPAHARKIKTKTKAGKNSGRSTMKALAAMAERLRSRTEKLKIEFSTNVGGPCGDNRRTFVDEVVWFTRLHTPLIGVKYWKHVNQEVKNKIAECVLNLWDIEDNDA
ncbi:hypothetical protein QOZ80_5AG0385710 [Eleusine coracana subsp. coracana]|nr:hypothetical protein QOZ80_5AG0385710 [Eleusine coracana subsp. coracana]